MVILASAKAGHGKNAYRQFMSRQILKRPGTMCQQVAFSDVLKQMCDELYQRLKPFFKKQYQFQAIDNQLKKVPVGMEFARTWWLALGRYAKKHFGDTIWIDAIFSEQFKKKFMSPQTNLKNFAIITDMRFKNQCQVPKKFGNEFVKMVRIWRPGDHPVAGFLGTSPELVNDKSQIDLDSIPKERWDRFVVNGAGIEQLKKDASDFVNILLK